jgi:hypothetical protein
VRRVMRSPNPRVNDGRILKPSIAASRAGSGLPGDERQAMRRVYDIFFGFGSSLGVSTRTSIWSRPMAYAW